MSTMLSTLQDRLSIAQAVPIVGPIIGSPIKFAVSKAEIITGIALAVFSVFAAILDTQTAKNMFTEGGKMIGEGFLHMGYAAANFCTAGILGLIIEISRHNLQGHTA